MQEEMKPAIEVFRSDEEPGREFRKKSLPWEWREEVPWGGGSRSHNFSERKDVSGGGGKSNKGRGESSRKGGLSICLARLFDALDKGDREQHRGKFLKLGPGVIHVGENPKKPWVASWDYHEKRRKNKGERNVRRSEKPWKN